MVDRSANQWVATMMAFTNRRREFLPRRCLSCGHFGRSFAVIYSTGYVSVSSIPATFTRTLRVTTANASLFSAGVAVKSNITLHGTSQYGVFADSFDSADPYHSLNGAYPFGYANRTKPNGDVASLFGDVSIATTRYLDGCGWVHRPAARRLHLKLPRV